jgi:hypothetical protein
LTAFKGELTKVFQTVNTIAPAIFTELSAMRKRNAARQKAESK